MLKNNTYIGLLREYGSEPSPESGYGRVCVEDVPILDIPALLHDRQIVFNDITEPGCGMITDIAAFDSREGGELLYTWHLPKAVNAHAGTIPVIHQGRLLLGVDVSAQIVLKLTDMCSTAAMQK